ncbi:nuclear transport factor 2 family protein [Pseudonocardia alaniniphila]|uniref:Nuclear transport factor 2 family protein n=1 Tax=Pseudonocardia alaniniphila TaxID=75291 RepID=A0ABS9TV11_9PSEU|nr:nuclear transport factor 2 family protein [Pseudonocardia alaniniphila]MCH6172400.1 nuclear transport factor 2 family protein [Pseudonocardia alaniniphila]
MSAARVIGAEPTLEALRARAACMDIVNASLRLVDEKRALSVLASYTEDAVMELGGAEVSGEALEAAMRSRDNDDIRRVHVPGQTDFWTEGPDRARAVTLLQLFNLGPDSSVVPPVAALTRLDDYFVRSDDSVWRLARRVVQPLAGG